MSKTKTNLMYALATNLAKYGKPETPKGAKHTHLTKKQNKEKEKYVKDLKKSLTEESAHYMFFQNLKTIKDAIDEMLQLDEKAVDNILSKGHDWASDHIATAKDDIEEVKDFLVNQNVVISENNKLRSIVAATLLAVGSLKPAEAKTPEGQHKIENVVNKLTPEQEIAIQFANYLNQSNSLDNNEFGFDQFKKNNATIANIGSVEYEDIENLIKKINNKYTLAK
jgi:hypothetical protein